MQKCLIIKLLQICKDPIYLQFGRLWSNRFGENGLTDACRAVFSKQAAPKSHAFLFCHEPLPPDTRCGELRGGLSSRVPATATQFRWICNPAQFRIHVPADYKSRRNTEARRRGTKMPARSTEFPLRRLAVRGCERTMRSIRDRISGAAECQGDCGAIEPTKPTTGMKWRLSIFEVALAIASAQRNKEASCGGVGLPAV